MSRFTMALVAVLGSLIGVGTCHTEVAEPAFLAASHKPSGGFADAHHHSPQASRASELSKLPTLTQHHLKP